MVQAPLFVGSMLELKDKLRLGGASSEANALIDEAVLKVRVAFYRKLTQARITTILAEAFVEAPTTEAQYLRALANTVEVKWVRMELLRTMPSLFMDGNGLQQVWNDEAAFREMDESSREAEIRRLTKEIADDLDILNGDESAGNETTVRSMNLEPEETPSRPGDTALDTTGGDTVLIGGFD